MNAPCKPEDVPRWVRRSLIIVVLPISILIDLVWRVWDQLRPLPLYWRCDISEEIADAKRWWR